MTSHLPLFFFLFLGLFFLLLFLFCSPFICAPAQLSSGLVDSVYCVLRISCIGCPGGMHEILGLGLRIFSCFLFVLSQPLLDAFSLGSFFFPSLFRLGHSALLCSLCVNRVHSLFPPLCE